jgi:hypothetical protein
VTEGMRMRANSPCAAKLCSRCHIRTHVNGLANIGRHCPHNRTGLVQHAPQSQQQFPERHVCSSCRPRRCCSWCTVCEWQPLRRANLKPVHRRLPRNTVRSVASSLCTRVGAGGCTSALWPCELTALCLGNDRHAGAPERDAGSAKRCTLRQRANPIRGDAAHDEKARHAN